MVEFQQSQKFTHKLSYLERRESYLYFLPSLIFLSLSLSTFVLEIVSDLQRSCKEKQEHPHVFLPSYSKCYFILLWYICQNQETNIGLFLFTALQALLGFHQFFH